jgi:hypothetical protein
MPGVLRDGDMMEISDMSWGYNVVKAKKNIINSTMGGINHVGG